MAIYRVQHQKNYTVVNNFICKDNRLSWKAKGIWLYAFSRPDDWTFILEDLIKQSIDGRDSVRAGLKELEEAGYLKRTKLRDDKGRMTTLEWTFYEVPQPKELKESLPETENPSLDKPSLDKHPLPSIDGLASPEEHTKTPPNPLSGECEGEALTKERYGDSKNVELTSQEILKLKEKFGAREFDEWIETLDIEIGKMGAVKFNKKYHSHYHTILSWHRLQSKKAAQTSAFRTDKVDRRTRDINNKPVEAPHLKDLF